MSVFALVPGHVLAPKTTPPWLRPSSRHLLGPQPWYQSTLSVLQISIVPFVVVSLYPQTKHLLFCCRSRTSSGFGVFADFLFLVDQMDSPWTNPPISEDGGLPEALPTLPSSADRLPVDFLPLPRQSALWPISSLANSPASGWPDQARDKSKSSGLDLQVKYCSYILSLYFVKSF